MGFFRAAKILQVNLRHNFLPHFAIAVAIALFTPLIFNISSLNAIGAAQPVEMLLCFAGTALLTPIFYPEQNKNIRDVIRSKRTDYMSVCFIRVVYSLIALAVIVGVFVTAMYFCESDVTWRHFLGGFASAFLLGSIGLCFAGVCGNVTVGYMASVIYYLANLALKKRLGAMCIFSMCFGLDFYNTYFMLAVSAVIIFIAFMVVYAKDNV